MWYAVFKGAQGAPLALRPPVRGWTSGFSRQGLPKPPSFSIDLCGAFPLSSVHGDTLFMNFGSQEASLTSATCGSTLPTPPCETTMQHATRGLRLAAYMVHNGNFSGMRRYTPTTPCKAETFRFQRRVAARCPCLCAELQIRFDGHRVRGASGARSRATHALAGLLLSLLSRCLIEQRLNPYTRISANTQRQVSKPPC